MKLSTRARYGARILFDLALHEGGPLPLRDIARRQQISLSYLAHLIAPLTGAGIIKSLRGGGGGIWLGRPLGEIRVSEVLRLLEGEPLLIDCVNNPEACAHSDLCVARDVWQEMEQAINRALDSITLQDMVERYRKKMVKF